MSQTPPASTSWKQPLLKKLATAHQDAVNGSADMIDVAVTLIGRLSECESEANQDFWTRLVSRVCTGEFTSFGHFAYTVPSFLHFVDPRLTPSASAYERSTRPQVTPLHAATKDIAAMEMRRRYSRPRREPTPAELRLAAMVTHANGNTGWDIIDAR